MAGNANSVGRAAPSAHGANVRKGRSRRSDDGPSHADYVLAFALYDSPAKVAAALGVTPKAVSAWQSAQRAALRARPRAQQILELLHIRPMRAGELATALGLTRDQAKDALKDLVRAGRVLSATRGVFALAPASGPPKKSSPTTRKPTPRGREFLRAYRRLHSVTAVARALSVTRASVYRWLIRLGLPLARDRPERLARDGGKTLAERVRGRLEEGPARAGDLAASLGVPEYLVRSSLTAMFLRGRIQRIARGLFAPLELAAPEPRAR